MSWKTKVVAVSQRKNIDNKNVQGRCFAIVLLTLNKFLLTQHFSIPEAAGSLRNEIFPVVTKY